MENSSRLRSASLPIDLYKFAQGLSFAGKVSTLAGLGLSNASQKTLVSKHDHQRSPKQPTSALDGEWNSGYIHLNRYDQPIFCLPKRSSTTGVNALNPTAAHDHSEESNHLLKAESNFNTTNTNSAIGERKRPEKDGTDRHLDRHVPSWRHTIRALMMGSCSIKTVGDHPNKFDDIGSNPRQESATFTGHSNLEADSSSNKMWPACITERQMNRNNDMNNMISVERIAQTNRDEALPYSQARVKSNIQLQPDIALNSQDSWNYSLEGMNAAIASIAQIHVQEQANNEIGSNQPVSAFDTDDSSTLREKSLSARLREKLSKQ